VITIVPVRYVCRTCETTRPIHVSPIEDDGDLVIDVEGRHRLARVECPECESSRIHVAARVVPDRVAEAPAEGEPA